MLNRAPQDSTVFDLGILIIPVLAMVPIASTSRRLPFWTLLMLQLLGLFPLFVVLAILLHLMGWNGLLDWLLRLL
jgi:hypothetical protein